MTTYTLLAKIYSSHQRKQIGDIISDLFEGLSVEATVTGEPGESWMQVIISGDDEEIAKNLLARDFGFCPTELSNVAVDSTLKGYVTNLQNSRDQLLVDIGILKPKAVYAAVPLGNLQSQLVDGKKLPLKRIAELWGLCENLPITVKVVSPEVKDGAVAAELAPEQTARFLHWRNSLLDRLLVLGESSEQVKLIVQSTGLERDVIDVEALGMFEHALVCKLGTDAAGLIGRLGSKLRKAKFTVFSPKPLVLAAQ
jgi:hypothetical protein